MKNAKKIIEEIILKGTPEEKRELYGFCSTTSEELILKKFKLFSRGNYPRYFEHKSAPFHDEWARAMIKAYFGRNELLIASRGLGKTTTKKIFDVFVLLNDKDTYRRYHKVLTRDLKNSKQIVTDVYNLIVEVKDVYGDFFQKEGDVKREETMTAFITSTGVKYAAGTVGQTQRGHIQDAYRPDFLWLEDCEDRDSIRSSVVTGATIGRIAEALDGLSKEGNFVMTANYISDQGVVEWIKGKPSVNTTITPLLSDPNDDKSSTWDIYSEEDVKRIRADADDFYGEYLCDPANAENKFFDLRRIDEDLKNCTEPISESAGVKYWKKYNPAHRYAMGNDFSEGVGLDSCTMSLYDFDIGEVVATYANNTIGPDLATFEFMRVGREYGNCLIIPETNNKCGGTAITTLKANNYPNVYQQKNDSLIKGRPTKHGWDTNSKTKYTAFFEFRRDYNDGLIKIHDKDLLKEMRAYSNNDLQEVQAGLVTKHFDLLMSAVIGWQGRKTATAVGGMKSYKGAYDDYLKD